MYGKAKKVFLAQVTTPVFFSRILRREALVTIHILLEQPFYGKYSTLDSHTKAVISHAVAYSSRWLPKPWGAPPATKDFWSNGYSTNGYFIL